MHSFWRFLEGLREKPPQVRAQFAFLGALSFTFLVGLVWVSTLPAQLSSLTENAKNNEVTAAVGEVQNKVKQVTGVSATTTSHISPTPAPPTELNLQSANFTQKNEPKNTPAVEASTKTGGTPVMIETTKTPAQPVMVEATSGPKTH